MPGPSLRARIATAAGPLIVVASVLFAGMALFAKAASAEVSGTQIGFVRAAFGVAACALVSVVRPLRPVDFRGLVLRGSTGAGAVYLYFQGIAHLPVGIATLLNYTSPVFTALWCALLFRERVARSTFVALVLTSLGLLCVLRGKLSLGITPPDVQAMISRYELVGLGGAVLSGLSMVFIARVRRTDGAWEIFAAFSLGCLIVMAPDAIAHWRAPSMHGWYMLGAMGVMSVTAQVLMTHAMRYLSATLSGVINQITPVTSLLVGAVAFHERFGALVMFGIGLTLAGGVLGAVLASLKPAATESAAAPSR